MTQYVYNKHNTTWKVLCTVFTHSLFLYKKSYSFAALTPSISDISPTRVKIPYARAFHEVISILILFMRDLDTVSKELQYMSFEKPSYVLTILILPIKVSFLFFQLLSVFSTEQTFSSKLRVLA